MEGDIEQVGCNELAVFQAGFMACINYIMNDSSRRDILEESFDKESLKTIIEEIWLDHPEIE